jgi:hypothetical protein
MYEWVTVRVAAMEEIFMEARAKRECLASCNPWITIFSHTPHTDGQVLPRDSSTKIYQLIPCNRRITSCCDVRSFSNIRSLVIYGSHKDIHSMISTTSVQICGILNEHLKITRYPTSWTIVHSIELSDVTIAQTLSLANCWSSLPNVRCFICYFNGT